MYLMHKKVKATRQTSFIYSIECSGKIMDWFLANLFILKI